LNDGELEYFTEFQVRANSEIVGEVKKGSSEQRKQERYLAGFFHKLQQCDVSKWRYIFDYYLVYTVHKSIRLRQALLHSDWQLYLFTLLHKAYPPQAPDDAPDKLIREIEEQRDQYFHLSASILAVTGQLIKHSFTENTGGLGEILTSSIAALYKNCPDYNEAESLSRRLLMVTIREIESAAQTFKLTYGHPGWANLLDYMTVLHDFIFFSPTPKKQILSPPAHSSKKKKEDREIKMHIGGNGSADATIVEALVNLLSTTLKVHSIDRVKESDREAAVIQKKLKARLDVEKEFWTQLHIFLQTLPLFKGSGSSKNMIATLIESAAKRESSIAKTQLEVALNGLVHVVALQATPRAKTRTKRSPSAGEPPDDLLGPVVAPVGGSAPAVVPAAVPAASAEG